MIGVKPQFVTDTQGNRTAVILDIETYQKMLAELEMTAAIRAFDEAMVNPGKPIPFEQAVKEIESSRNDL